MNPKAIHIVCLKRDLKLQAHEPFKMSLMEQNFCGITIGEHYPALIVNLKINAKKTKDKIWSHKNFPAVTADKHRVLATHVNKKR